MWLGKCISSDQLVAMKQFPKTGKQVDQSAHVEIQIHQIIKRHSEKHGKLRHSKVR